MISIGSAHRRLKSARRRLRKLAVRMSRRPKVPVFVVGCQRSGTTMLLKALSQAPECRVFHENDPAAFDARWRLRGDDTIRRLIEETPEPVLVFKPLLDSQYTSHLLTLHHNARAIWPYRHYRDMVGSGVEKWGGSLRDAMWGIASDTYRAPAQPVMLEKMSGETVELLRSLCGGQEPSAEDGALLHWYVRNVLYFDVCRDPRVMLVKYEDLVQQPAVHFPRIFEFIGARFFPEYASFIHTKSVRKHDLPRFDPKIEETCESLLRSLDALSAGNGRMEHDR